MSCAIEVVIEESKKLVLDMISTISNDRASVTAPLNPHQPSKDASFHLNRENGWKTKMLRGLAITIMMNAHIRPHGSTLKSESGSIRAANEQ